MLASLVLITALACLAGYFLHITALIRVSSSLQGMSVLTATGLAALSLTIVGGHPRRKYFAMGCAYVALSVGAATLLSHGFTGRDRISPLLARAFFSSDDAEVGRTSVATALCIALLAIAQLQRLNRRSTAADFIASATSLLSGTALLGYAYGVRELYALYLFNTMAVHTAAALFAMSLATSLAQARFGWLSVLASTRSGGNAIRRQILFALLPPIAGGVLLHEAQTSSMGPAVAMALLVMLTIAPLIALIIHDGKILDALDIEREARDQVLKRAEQTLQSRLAEQAAALSHESAQRANAEASMHAAQRLEAVGQLTGGIAHDFNNLLMAIAGNLHLTRASIGPDHAARKLIDNASSATQRGTRLTGQLLAFSRTQRIDVQPIELDEVVRASRDLFVHALSTRIEIELSLDAVGSWVLADPDQLQLSILNLALNARDAMSSGGTLRIETASRISDPTFPNARAYALIRVTDNGHGMTAEVMRRATEPFFTTKERGKGTGLGLAQVYGVVKQCGGELRIRSEVGKGSTFEILLPVSEPRVTAPHVAAHVDAMDTPIVPSGPLLVVDDDELVRGALAEMFRTEGYEVVEAEDGHAGLSLLTQIAPSLAVIDFLMPGMNGADVARAARAILPTLPIIFVSGYSDTIALDEISNAVVLRKPVSPEALLSAVADSLR